MKNIFEHLSPVDDYDRGKQDIADKIVNKQSRGNIFAQNGWFLTRKKLDEKSKLADKSIRKLIKLFPRSA